MSSLVRTLKLAVSSNKEVESPSAQASPVALNQTRSGSIAASASFSDFSLSTRNDVENEYSADRRPPSTSRRHSLEEFLPVSPRWLRNPYFLSSEAPAPTAAIAIPAVGGSAHASQASNNADQAQTIPRRREGKISGMDYYDYCELIRSSSL